MQSDIDLKMTARITATVPDYVMYGIKQLSIQQGREPSNMAAFLLEQAVIQGIANGLIPAEKGIPTKITADINLIAQRQKKDSAEVMAYLLSRAIAEGIGEEENTAERREY